MSINKYPDDITKQLEEEFERQAMLLNEELNGSNSVEYTTVITEPTMPKTKIKSKEIDNITRNLYKNKIKMKRNTKRNGVQYAVLNSKTTAGAGLICKQEYQSSIEFDYMDNNEQYTNSSLQKANGPPP